MEIHGRMLASRFGSILAGDPPARDSAGYSAGSTGRLLWRDTRRGPLASYWDTQRDTQRDLLAGCSGRICGVAGALSNGRPPECAVRLGPG